MNYLTTLEHLKKTLTIIGLCVSLMFGVGASTTEVADYYVVIASDVW